MDVRNLLSISSCSCAKYAMESAAPKQESTNAQPAILSSLPCIKPCHIISTTNNNDESDTGFHIGIYGWRKRCLYIILLVLLTMVTVNIALTLWILKVMQFSSDGMGNLRIIPGGIQLNGEALILNSLIASKIRSRKGQPVIVESSRNVTFQARNSEGKVVNKLFIGEDRVECSAKKLLIRDPKGKILFAADKHEVVVGADVLRVTGNGGAVFDDSIQTPLIRADSGYELKLESPTRSLKVEAPLGIAIESRAGDISSICLGDLKLQSLAGSILLDSSNVFLKKLQTAKQSSFRSSESRSVRKEIYQICVCGNGRLFVAPSDGLCAADSDICQ